MGPAAARRVGIYEAKTHFSKLVKAVESGQEIVITDHGRDVARLVPTQAATEALAEEFIAWRKGAKLSLGLPLREAITEGRR